MKAPFRFGIDTLLAAHLDWISRGRIGLVAHPASVTAGGPPVPLAVRGILGERLTCLFGPEHGFLGGGGAGENIGGTIHPDWGIPVFSLYGETRKPTPDMLRHVDTILFDLQDLGARPYTYVSTLRHVLEAAAENGKAVIVADRPAPLPNCVDGPMLEPAFESFVGFIPAPVVYGMTAGETARWLKKKLRIDLDLRVAEMAGYERTARWPVAVWTKPSPAIVSLKSAQCFPMTVFLEAVPSLDHGRGTETPFQVFGAPWMDSDAVRVELEKSRLPGVQFNTTSYRAAVGLHRGLEIRGLCIGISDADSLRPVQTAYLLLQAVIRVHGLAAVWSVPGTREGFFDKLAGTDCMRKALQSSRDSGTVIGAWESECREFLAERRDALLYPANRTP